MIHRFLVSKGFAGITNWIWIAAVAALIALAFVVVAIAKNRDAALIETANDAGVTQAVNAGHETTFEQLENADDAEQDLRSSGERSAERYAGCLRDDRNGNCERFRPIDQ